MVMVISKPFMALPLYRAGPGALLFTPFTVRGFKNVVDGAADTVGGDAGIPRRHSLGSHLDEASSARSIPRHPARLPGRRARDPARRARRGHLAAIRGEAKQLLAAVAGVPPPAEQTTALQFVKRCDDRGTTDPKRRSKALLGAGFNG
jgi:hypothetical protein